MRRRRRLSKSNKVIYILFIDSHFKKNNWNIKLGIKLVFHLQKLKSSCTDSKQKMKCGSWQKVKRIVGKVKKEKNIRESLIIFWSYLTHITDCTGEVILGFGVARYNIIIDAAAYCRLTTGERKLTDGGINQALMAVLMSASITMWLSEAWRLSEHIG